MSIAVTAYAHLAFGFLSVALLFVFVIWRIQVARGEAGSFNQVMANLLGWMIGIIGLMLLFGLVLA